LFLEESVGEKASLRDGYEQMRACALSPETVEVRVLGSDLFLKKGFLSWILAMLPMKSTPTPERRIPVSFTKSDLSSAIVMPLANILMRWSVEEDGISGRQNKKRALKPKGVPVHTAIHPTPGN
jgi:hypothetical protein